MLRFWDFECPNHGAWEVLLDAVPPDAIFCPECKAISPRIWRHAPLMAGPEKGRYPYFDVQLGKRIESKKDLDATLAAKGLVKMGVDEHRATVYRQPPPSDDVLDAEAKKEFRECALKAYHDVETREIPLEPHPSVEETEALPMNVPEPKE